MNRLNPLYIIALFATVVFLSFYLLKNEVKLFDEKNKEFSSIQVKAKEYSEFKSSWNNQRYIDRVINEILRDRKIKTAKILKAKNNNLLKIKVVSSDPTILNTFLNRVLNKKLQIKKLQIEKEFVNLEIGLK